MGYHCHNLFGSSGFANSTSSHYTELAEVLLVLCIAEQRQLSAGTVEKNLSSLSMRCAHICLQVFWHLLQCKLCLVATNLYVCCLKKNQQSHRSDLTFLPLGVPSFPRDAEAFANSFDNCFANFMTQKLHVNISYCFQSQ